MIKLWQLFPLSVIGVIYGGVATAQIIPDSSVGTVVVPNANVNGVLTNQINGGAIRNSNLFHSFQQFNIGTGESAYFANPNGITNIFTRVTGGSASNINGKLGILGDANLYFMNPSGIVFGAGAVLDVKGSFLATTANSINFSDGTQYTASYQATPVLTVSVPVGLGFGSKLAPIQVQGTGHNLTTIPTSKDAYPPYVREKNPQALTVQPGKTLALVGGKVDIEGGQLLAEHGRIEVGAVENGEVKLNTTSNGFTLSYAGISNFGDIQLSKKAAIDASGSNINGGIQVAGREIRLTDGSVGLIKNLESQEPGSNINVLASELLEFSGTVPNGKIGSQFITETTTAQNSGNINVSTKNLIFRSGGLIVSRTFGTGGSGNVNINASESVQAIGTAAPLNPRFVSGIFVSVNGSSSADAGDLNISTKNFRAFDGAIISTASYSGGNGGDLKINAESVDISGVDPVFNGATDLRVGSFSGGNGGNLTINTQTLMVRDGARLNGTTVGQGSAGSITINAEQQVDIKGGNITSSAIFPDFRAIINGFASDPTGKAGAVTINTNRLTIRENGKVSVANSGPTNAGKLDINAGSILLDSQGLLSASTRAGEGGNIFLKADNLVMRGGSAITTTAGGTGNGGNITMKTGAFAQIEASKITANAGKGRGGNIIINTEGFFQSPDSIISASSELGINGVVQISTLNANNENSLQQQPSNFANTDTIVSSSCLAQRNSQNGKFVVSGNGGLPETPSDRDMQYEIVQVRSSLTTLNNTSTQQESVQRGWKLGDAIQEASQLITTSSGRLMLIANTGATISEQNSICR
ncbi:MAG: filamentous hemagglutinin N-terminal domain-containing protein [Scytonematopsis contorta HA4267-MV1]|jgi:filamentous hemagglutinin family protein|nr:filamentous hemagglutinin N-terminal domain-containing protein [Scytonematopsis contorta HA4267-MV1]